MKLGLHLAAAVLVLLPCASAGAQPLDVAFPEVEHLARECSDGIDNDGDGAVDLQEDRSCRGRPLGSESD